jgi:cyclophilin family peptidyl-prolyl cis-trans isomerase
MLIALAAATIALTGAGPQGYTPKAGERVLRMEVQGRGNVWIRLETRGAPRASAHISGLAQRGFYDGQRFFEVVKTPRPYLARFGDPLSRDAKNLDDPRMGTSGTGAKIPFENSGLKHDRGAVGLAHPQGDKDTGDCQFYIMLARASFLDNSYTVFGQVVAGMEVVDKVEKGDVVVSVKVVEG